MKKDIENNDDIKLMVDTFYTQVQQNDLLNNVFNTTMNVNWAAHLPKMYSFWEFILFHTGDYTGAPFPHHTAVNDKIPLTAAHFDTWIELFNQTVDSLFDGPNASTIKQKAHNIKVVWSYKFTHINEQRAQS